MASSSLAARASGRGRPQGVDPLAAQVSLISFIQGMQNNLKQASGENIPLQHLSYQGRA